MTSTAIERKNRSGVAPERLDTAIERDDNIYELRGKGVAVKLLSAALNIQVASIFLGLREKKYNESTT